MEHNVEKLIRQKVHEADQLAVTWRKEWVWDHVDLAHERKPARWFYYAAASILLAGVAVVSFIQWNQRQLVLSKINALEMKIAETLEAQRSIATPVDVSEANCDQSPEIAGPVEQKQLAKRHVDRQPAPEVITSAPIEIQPNDVSITYVEPPAQPLESSVAANQVPTPAVQAIIGIIPVQTQTVARTSSRKLRLRLFNAPLDAEYLSLNENKFITAKLK